MKPKEYLQSKRQEILSLAAQHGAYNVRLFGSVARGEAGPKSDVDILIDLESGRSLLDQIALGQDLGDLLGCSVDVVTEKALHWYIKDKILQEAVPI
jgi:hypothetical protein